MKPSIKRVSCVLLAFLWIPPQEVKPLVQTGDVHIHQTIITGSNNVIVRE